MATAALIFIFSTVVWCLPGLYLAAALNVSRRRPGARVLISGWAINAAIAYAAFWIWFQDRTAGAVFSTGVCIAAFIMLASLFFRPRILNELCAPDVWRPTALMLLVAAFYLAILTNCQGEDLRVNAAAHRFLSSDLKEDNILPRRFAERLYKGEDPRLLGGNGHDIATWHSSDRPPLQSGIELIQYPVSEYLHWNDKIQYQIAGLLAQCIWIPALWVLCRALRLSNRALAITLAAAIFSGFFLVNSLYVWPKLLAAGLALMALALVIAQQWWSADAELGNTVLAASLAALAMLAHAGVAFFFPALAFVAWRRRFMTRAQSLFAGIAVLALFLAPWSAYQKLYDPPGNRLMKWHLAGAVGLDGLDDRSVLQTVRDSYSALTPRQYADNKWANVKELVGIHAEIPEPPPLDPLSFIWPRRDDEFYFIAQALGILNLGWLALVAVLCFKRDAEPPIESHLRRPAGDAFAASALLLAMALSSITLWVLALFLPGTTVVHAGSYAVMMALFAGLALALSELPGWIVAPILAAQVLHFMLIWAFGQLPEGAQLKPLLAAATIVLAAGILWALAALASSTRETLTE